MPIPPRQQLAIGTEQDGERRLAVDHAVDRPRWLDSLTSHTGCSVPPLFLVALTMLGYSFLSGLLIADPYNLLLFLSMIDMLLSVSNYML
jgi:tetrahydromethanopterin S-methyltransferase subunit E